MLWTFNAQARLDYHINLQVDWPEQQIQVDIQLRSDTDTQVLLHWNEHMQSVMLAGKPGNRLLQRLPLNLQAGKSFPLSYRFKPNRTQHNLLDAENLVLSGHWYPYPEQLAYYQLQTRLPEGFTANSESDRTQQDKAGNLKFIFDYPRDSVNLIASKHYQIQQQTYSGKTGEVQLETFFTPENARQAKTYLAYTQHYIKLYEKLLTPYPYKRFAIVSNLFPTGWSLPSYTLLGSRVIRLPFIVRTSLGHEILHQWFGNSVYIDQSGGNWSEGLTNYLADYEYANQRGEGAAFRKQLLTDYSIRVTEDKAFPLQDFHSRTNKAQSAIGYGKSAMVFHQLRQRYGDDDFFKALRLLIQNKQFQRAGWTDIQHAFEQVSKDTLADFFSDWLTRKDIPALQVENAGLSIIKGQLKLQFEVLQTTETAYILRVPLHLEYEAADNKTRWEIQWLDLKDKKTTVRLALEQRPLNIVLDKDYDVMRKLDAAETPPVLAHILEQKQDLLIIGEAQQGSTYQPLLASLGLENISLSSAENSDWAMLQKNTVVLLGRDNPLAAQWLAGQHLPEAEVALRVFKNPLNPHYKLLWLAAHNAEQAARNARRLPHYGKYTEIAFTGKSVQKNIQDTVSGIPVLSHEAVQALRFSGQQNLQLTTLNKILPELAQSPVIFIGEHHDQYAHHINQLEIIRFLQQQGKPIAIGMEMFAREAQSVLDAYIAGDINEAQFLRKSNYFTQWRFDYNLYKPIIDYAKTHKIPLIALNLNGKITRQTARNGLPSLEAAQQKQIPAALDFSGMDYQQDLQAVYGLHRNAMAKAFKMPLKHTKKSEQAKPEITAQDAEKQHQEKIEKKPPLKTDKPTHQHGMPSEHGKRSFTHFLQAQILWDEGMAEVAHQYLQQHPDTQLVILAGNGHIRNDYGIPQRLFRRAQRPYLTLLQDDNIQADIGDYILLSPELEGQAAPKMGVIIEDKPEGVEIQDIVPDSPAQAAGVAKQDWIIKLGDIPIQTLTDLKIALFQIGAGQQATLHLKRGEKIIQLSIQF
ncbi:ChaN family lipoprotein [Candidatus Venteria ishoeyi]|uniref:ChaN family lipoprotein n=1 Tax=Candidatus Venteria ishoeyi TaxID=1899563 RepID=UPI0025A6632D|nr:ChaN family lipoprotein [Candidatus Venteria ishoeyi]MDM8546659.1 ChaN family lipoprotein [Candidatus Venteria ishoeyi]